MNQPASNQENVSEQLSSLKQAFEFFTSATNDFKTAYGQLEQRVAKLNFELERKNAELQDSLGEARSLKEYLDNILTSMDSGVISTDRDGKITLLNQAAEKLTGYTTQDVIDKHYNQVFACEGDDSSDPETVIRTGKKLVHYEKNIKCADGRRLPVKSSMKALKSEAREPIGIVEVFEDLSEIRKLEREVHQIRTLSALGEMAGDVAHEIRNPLGAIAGFAALLERDLGSDDPRQRLVRKIIEAVGKMDGIIGNLVFLARPIEPNLRKVNLSQLTAEVVEHFAFQTKENEKQVKFVTHFASSEVFLNADPQLLQQMLLHLIRNATESGEQHGEIKIEIKKPRGQEIRLSISDDGGGIPPDIRKRLYHPFTTNKSKKPGLGLSIVRKIVDLHNARITIKSSPKSGTKVLLIFPA